MRKAAIVVASVLAAAVLLALVLPRVILLEALKPRIIALLEEKTGRKVSFSKISLSLFPGVGARITEFSISGDPGHAGENLLSVPEAEIRVALLPLFAGRAEFRKLLLRRPEVVFRKYRDGTHSATQILARLAREEAKAGEEKAPPSKERVSIALKDLLVEKAKFNLILPGEDGGEARWTIDPFTFGLSGIGDARNDFKIETRIDGAVRGELGFAGRLTREGGVVAGPAAYRVAAKGKVFGQPVTIDGKVSTPSGPTQMDLAITLPKIEVGQIPGVFARPPAMLSGFSPKGEAALSVRVSGNLDSMGLAAELRFASLSASARGSLAPSAGAREWSASARITSLADLAKGLGEGFSKWAPAGRLALSARGRRTAASAKETWGASMDLVDVGAEISDPKMRLQGLNGNVDLSEGKVDFRPLAGSLNGQRFTVRGPVSLGAVPPAGTVSLRMSSLDLDALFPPGDAGKRAKQKEPSSPAEKGGEGISARGELRIDAGKGRGLEFQDLSGSGRYEGGILFLDSLRVRLYGGSATVSGRVRLSGKAPEFRVKAAVKDVAAEEILSRKTSLKDFFFGKASVSADLAGGTKDFADFTRTAAGSGSFRVADGRIKGVDLLGIAADRSGLSSVLPGLQAKKAGTGETSFSDLSADFRVEGGKIRTNELRIVSEKMSLVGPAAIGFDRTVEFRGTLMLSKDLSERARGAGGQFLTGRSGRVEVPLVISGNVASPAVSVDREALARGAAEKALKGLNERLRGTTPSEGAKAGKPADRAEPGKALEGLIDKLLPRKK